MGKIEVTITDQAGGKTVKAELPDHVPIERFIPALIDRMGWPILNTYDGSLQGLTKKDPVQLQHKETKRFLTGKDTLANSGVQKGDTLRFVLWLMPGRPDIEEEITLISEKKFHELAVVVALQIGELVTALILPKKLFLSFLPRFIKHQLYHRGQSAVGYSVLHNEIHNETTGIVIDTSDNSSRVVGDVISSGDFIRAISRTSTKTVKVDQELLSQIKIYPKESGSE